MLPTVSTLMQYAPQGASPCFVEQKLAKIEVEYLNLNGLTLPVPSRILSPEAEVREQSLAKIISRAAKTTP